VDGAEGVQPGDQSTDVTKGKSIKNWKTDRTPDQVGKTLESNGFKKGATADGSRIQYTKGDTEITMYPKAKSTGGPSMQVKVGGEEVSKVRMK
jgi:predicted RNA binding protein YcfA (HicA-like mRNA interferase family)